MATKKKKGLPHSAIMQISVKMTNHEPFSFSPKQGEPIFRQLQKRGKKIFMCLSRRHKKQNVGFKWTPPYKVFKKNYFCDLTFKFYVKPF